MEGMLDGERFPYITRRDLESALKTRSKEEVIDLLKRGGVYTKALEEDLDKIIKRGKENG